MPDYSLDVHESRRRAMRDDTAVMTRAHGDVFTDSSVSPLLLEATLVTSSLSLSSSDRQERCKDFGNCNNAEIQLQVFIVSDSQDVSHIASANATNHEMCKRAHVPLRQHSAHLFAAQSAFCPELSEQEQLVSASQEHTPAIQQAPLKQPRKEPSASKTLVVRT